MRHRTPILASLAAAAVLIANFASAEPPTQGAPKQAPPAEPKFEVDVPKDPFVDGKVPAEPAKPKGGVVVADVVDPAAYAIVQRNAMATWEQRRPFREVLAEDDEVTAQLDAAALDACFDLAKALENTANTFAVLDEIVPE